MSPDLPRVWFERYPPPEILDEVLSTVSLLGPGEMTPGEPFADVGAAAGIVAGAWVYDPSVMDLAPRLRVSARTGIGVDRVDVTAASARGIAVCNAPDGPTVPTAEHTVALVLAAAKRLTSSQPFGGHVSVELAGKTLGLVGLGRIARRVASAAMALGMAVKAYDPYAGDFPDGVSRAGSLVDALDADVVSLHLPLTAETAGLIDGEAFAAMRDDAIFVNTARGGLVDHDALLRTLDERPGFVAALDVTVPEPLPDGHPLLDRDDAIVTPHVAAATVEGKERMARIAFGQVVDVLAGRRPAHLVNPEVWDAA